MNRVHFFLSHSLFLMNSTRFASCYTSFPLPFPWGFTSFPYLWLIYTSCSLISDSTLPCSLSILRLPFGYTYKPTSSVLRFSPYNTLFSHSFLLFLKHSLTSFYILYFSLTLSFFFSSIASLWLTSFHMILSSDSCLFITLCSMLRFTRYINQ